MIAEPSDWAFWLILGLLVFLMLLPMLRRQRLALARANLTGEGSRASNSRGGGQADLLSFPDRDRQRRAGG